MARGVGVYARESARACVSVRCRVCVVCVVCGCARGPPEARPGIYLTQTQQTKNRRQNFGFGHPGERR